MSGNTAQTSPASDSYLVISATFTADLIRETLDFWISELGLDLKIKLAPYNQVFQQLLDPASLLARNHAGVNVILVRFEDWAHPAASDFDGLEQNVRHFVSCLRSASFASPVFVCVCPPSPAFVEDPRRESFVRKMEELVQSVVCGLSTVHSVQMGELSNLYPVEEIHDPHGDELGHIPYTPDFFTALGTMLARKVRAIQATPYKVVVLDCDDTLWLGICGEDGPEGIVVDPSRKSLQEFMLAQHDAGMLLCLCSKNNEEDVLDTFHLNPGMPLRLEHFVARRINWEPKSTNLVDLARDLDLGLDSFILVDDNPKECAEVEANCPEVLTVPLPRQADEIPFFLRHVWAFDRLKVTAEDRKRTTLYAQQIERTQLEKQAASLEEFLASLNLQVRIAPLSPDQLPRVSQLTQRTNQMNLTTIRRTESEIQALVNSGAAECLTVDVSDRFGSYGLTGVLIFRTASETLEVDTFLLSCRVLGRGVEHRMLRRLGEIAAARGLRRVDVPFVPTHRNRLALRFLESVGLDFRTENSEGLLFRFPVEHAERIIYKPESTPSKVSRSAAPAADTASIAGREQVDFVEIATSLRDVRRIQERARAGIRETGVLITPSSPPRTGLEQRLVEIWADLLALPAVGIQDNFFDLGGHSLMAVQLLSRVRQEFHVDLSLEVVYSGAFTVDELAKAIEVREIEQAGVDQYTGLLEELEGLSDEEVKALLAKEREESPSGADPWSAAK